LADPTSSTSATDVYEWATQNMYGTQQKKCINSPTNEEKHDFFLSQKKKNIKKAHFFCPCHRDSVIYIAAEFVNETREPRCVADMLR
jgi:hypothetical protein